MAMKEVPFQAKNNNVRGSRQTITSPNDSSLSKQPQQSQTFRSSCFDLQMRNHNSKAYKQERDASPTTTFVTARQQEFMHQLESSLVNENRNLQQHNIFLVGQIKSLFEREKQYAGALKRAKRENRELLEANYQLQRQLQELTKHTLKQIEKIQKILNSQRNYVQEELRVSSQSSDFKNEGLGWETEATLNQNLEDLKSKMTLYSKHPTFRSSFSFERDMEAKQMKKLSSRASKSRQVKESKITEASIRVLPPPDQLLTAYLPSPQPSLLPSHSHKRSGNHK